MKKVLKTINKEFASMWDDILKTYYSGLTL